jgi:SAM-dependent methyltransferase
MDASDDVGALKKRLKATWMAGDYGHFSQHLLPGAVEFAERLGIEPGTRVLDVACGSGQLAFLAARAGAEVTGCDIASNLIEQARARAEREGVAIRFDEGDAEALPYPDASFDLVTSLFGAMFAPRPERVAAELTRVCRPGGRIAMGNWTPESFPGQFFRTVGRHVPPPPMPAPTLWGDEATVRERLREGIAELRMERRMYPLRFPFPPEGVVEFFRTYFGPLNRAFAALDAEGQAALRRDLEQLWSAHNEATDGTTAVAAEYLEVVARRG